MPAPPRLRARVRPANSQVLTEENGWIIVSPTRAARPLIRIMLDRIDGFISYRSGQMNTRKVFTRFAGLVTGVLASYAISSVILPPVATAQGSPKLYIYPLKQQSSQQQDRDRYECHSWAVQQTGYDPSRANPDNPTYLDPQPYQPSQRHVARGAARGAALGAVGGAITGNAGTGAAAGAAMGGLAGGFRRRDERRQQAAQQQAQAASTTNSQQMSYTRAMAACLEGRSYSVK